MLQAPKISSVIQVHKDSSAIKGLSRQKKILELERQFRLDNQNTDEQNKTGLGKEVRSQPEEVGVLESLKNAGFHEIDDISWCTREDLRQLANGDEALITGMINKSPEGISQRSEIRARLVKGMPKCILVTVPGSHGRTLHEDLSQKPVEKLSQGFNQGIYAQEEKELYIKQTGIDESEFDSIDLERPSDELRHRLQTLAFKKTEIGFGEKKLKILHLGASNIQAYTLFENTGNAAIKYLQKKFDTSPPKTILGELKPGESIINSGDLRFEVRVDEAGDSSYLKFDHDIKHLAPILADNKIKNSREVLSSTDFKEINGTTVATENADMLRDHESSENKPEITKVLSNLQDSKSVMSVMADLGGYKFLRDLFGDMPYGCTHMMNLVNRLGIRFFQEGGEGLDSLLPHIEGDGCYTGSNSDGMPTISQMMKMQKKISQYKIVCKFIFGTNHIEGKSLNLDNETLNMVLEARHYYKHMMDQVGNPDFTPEVRFGFNVINTAMSNNIPPSLLTDSVDDIYKLDTPEYKDDQVQEGVGGISRLILEAGQQMVKRKNNPEYDQGFDLKTLELITISSVQGIDYEKNPKLVKDILAMTTAMAKSYFENGLFEYIPDAEVVAGKRKISYGTIRGVITKPEYFERFLSQIEIEKNKLINNSYSQPVKLNQPVL